MTLVAAHAYNTAKPTGLDGTEPVWSLTRAEAQALTRPDVKDAIVAIDARLPEDARVGVTALDEWVYPLYGRELERRVIPLPDSEPLAAAERLGLDWVVVGTPCAWSVDPPGLAAAALPRLGLDALRPLAERHEPRGGRLEGGDDGLPLAQRQPLRRRAS